MPRNQRDEGQATFTVTNFTQDFTLNCNEEANALLVADVLATLIRELIRNGTISGTIS